MYKYGNDEMPLQVQWVTNVFVFGFFKFLIFYCFVFKTMKLNKFIQLVTFANIAYSVFE